LVETNYEAKYVNKAPCITDIQMTFKTAQTQLAVSLVPPRLGEFAICASLTGAILRKG